MTPARIIIKRLMAASALFLLLLGGMPHTAAALTNPGSGSIGLQGEISTAAPKRGATIAVPITGSTFSKLPITVSGLCPSNLLVKIFSNNVFVGSTVCTNGSYSLQVDLFSGRNDLVARVYDALDQPGPDSNIVTVTYVSAQFIAPGTQLTLTSNYGSKGADPGSELDWPVILTGGVGPYAIEVDWGDGTSSLMSVSFPGNITISHTYKNAGIYKVIVRATDSKGNSAYLPLVAIANGQIKPISGAGRNTNTQTTVVKVLWWPILLTIPLIVAAFYLGRRHELYVLRKHLEQVRG